MNNASLFSRACEILTKAKSIGICIPSNPSPDAIASAVSLYLALIKLGKQAKIACSSPVNATADIIGTENIGSSLASGGNDLIVSFPYEEGSVDKVTYNIEGNQFNLVIQPRQGFEKLDPKKVKYSYSGAMAEVVVVIDAPNLQSLGELYTSNEEQFKSRDIINIDRHLTNANFGTTNIIEKKSSSISEIMLRLIQALNVQTDKQIASNLYNGIVASTNNFTAYSVGPTTFEASAILLKNGAVKQAGSPILQEQEMQRMSQTQQSYTRPMNSRFAPLASQFPTQGFGQGGVPFNQRYPTRQPTQQGYQPSTMNNQQGFGSGQQSVTSSTYSPAVSQSTIPQNQINSTTSNQIPQPRQQINQPQQQPQNIIDQLPQKEAIQQDIQKVEKKEAKTDEGAVSTGEGEGAISAGEKKEAPRDWLKPKIFQGSNLV